MVNFEVIIGIENHVELKTKTKMFSAGPVTYGAKPNSMVNIMDAGYPGVMPTVNKKGVELALLACQALNLTIDPIVQFDRKNYYYPDLAKGFQITQQYYPIGRNGHLTIIDEDGTQLRIAIERLHIEEDTAKQLHEDVGTLLDYNRAGIGLIEIVTEPVLRSGFQVRKYLEALREILIYTQVSDAKMNEGSLRCDVNISLRPVGVSTFGNKVELKNLNSIANVEKAIEYEIKRQTEILLMGQTVEQETRRFDEKTKTTILMRKKTDATDYKYFSEPNIFPIQLSATWIKNVLSKMPELPATKRQRYLTELNLKATDVDIILQDYDLMTFFEAAIKLSSQYETIVHYLTGEVAAYLNQKNLTLIETALTPQNLVAMINLITKNVISNKQAKTVLQRILAEDYPPAKIVADLGLKQVSDPAEIKAIIKPVFDRNLAMLEQYDQRPERVIKFFMGELMKLTKGQVAPEIGQQVVLELIIGKLGK
ncbi:aspartyl/glutamyl-tRNA amidotransferase subunit B [Spiroplasma sp. NBRC 100390]|uniref:Asp-tRNA(Asn)/Glu-tRNA(Gln) amidotransferase subunit GatB n=1 Tax=unclassified Spiroplasma TaxID=2637901 RepID=UPI0008929C62|nr:MULTISPECIES: Asp-tRNA(Asn)/Glu-tRNA(Gln) amidotransferase subunit GatB [unclassified Spiroplasma]AOX44297.1 aspartyl/glutamyl-tRNA amidotransferase subunit B [Spiroplasma sp. TU-14]APE13767.1 aspartyl/glutamyl-tRNA amidotransferase subunit B [Spiroplasma sp. NBRC 100390]